MYPAPLFHYGIITFDDLPNSIYFDGILLEKFGPVEDNGVIYVYQNPDNPYQSGANETVIYTEDAGDDSSTWVWFAGDIITQPTCLINFDPLFTDEFNDTYTVSGPESGTITRQSPCIWQGDGFTLRYRSQTIPRAEGAPFISNVGKWQLVTPEDGSFIKDGFQNSPADDYGDYSIA